MTIDIPYEINEKIYYGIIKLDDIDVLELTILKFEIAASDSIIIYYITEDGSLGSVDYSEINNRYFKTYEEAYKYIKNKIDNEPEV